MKGMAIWTALIGLALFPVGACSRTPIPIPVGTDTYYYGYIDSGEKFGVRVGATRDEARTVLEKRGFWYAGEDNCSHSLKRLIDCAPTHRSDVYRVRAFMRDGIVNLEFKEDRIAAIIWDLHALPNMDL